MIQDTGQHILHRKENTDKNMFLSLNEEKNLVGIFFFRNVYEEDKDK